MDELLSLKWNNHKLTFIHILGILRDKELYTDATIACEGILYSVHKLVLSTCSNYFSDILGKIKCKNPVIVLKDIKHKDLEALLDYMYLGEVNVQQGDLASLIKAAECLCIKGLAETDDYSHKRLKSDDSEIKQSDSCSSPAAKRKKWDDAAVSNSKPLDDSESYTNHVSGPLKLKNSATPSRSVTHKESVNHQVKAENVDNMFPQVIIPKLENTLSMACSTITNLVDPVIKEETDTNDRSFDCFTVGDDYLVYKNEEDDRMRLNNIRNTFPTFLQKGGGEMLQNSTYKQSSHTNNSVVQLEDDDDEDSPYSLSGAQSANGNDGVTGALDGSDDRDSHFLSSDQTIEDNSNASSSRCLVCNKVFTGAKTKFRLERHMFIHTGQRPYQCLMCDYRAGLKEHLTRHIKSQHSFQN